MGFYFLYFSSMAITAFVVSRVFTKTNDTKTIKRTVTSTFTYLWDADVLRILMSDYLYYNMGTYLCQNMGTKHSISMVDPDLLHGYVKISIEYNGNKYHVTMDVLGTVFVGTPYISEHWNKCIIRDTTWESFSKCTVKTKIIDSKSQRYIHYLGSDEEFQNHREIADSCTEWLAEFVKGFLDGYIYERFHQARLDIVQYPDQHTTPDCARSIFNAIVRFVNSPYFDGKRLTHANSSTLIEPIQLGTAGTSKTHRV